MSSAGMTPLGVSKAAVVIDPTYEGASASGASPEVLSYPPPPPHKAGYEGTFGPVMTACPSPYTEEPPYPKKPPFVPAALLRYTEGAAKRIERVMTNDDCCFSSGTSVRS